MKTIKNVLDELEIPKRKELLLKNKREIMNLKCELSELCMHKNVAQYAYNLQMIDYLNKINNTNPVYKINDFIDHNKLLEKDGYVLLYKEFLGLLKMLELENNNYPKLIQTTLREHLMSLNAPKIYIYQGKIEDGIDYYVDIISKSSYMSESSKPRTSIFPYEDIDSNRKFRHFYNNVSYKYLESLTDDYSFDLDNKRLGRVKIYKR